MGHDQTGGLDRLREFTNVTTVVVGAP